MPGGKSNQAGFQPDSDVHVTFEDQQKINKFAKQNAKLNDYKDELKNKQNELKNLEDAFDELGLMDDDAKVPYFIGEIFVHQSLETTQSCMEDARTKKQAEITNLESKYKSLKTLMTGLKTQLYATFGEHINLESEEE